jgi:SAM-dependent methyltransferase/predicted RNA-binding Zn-ribbon protein involved in translation (DUF1610 family)
MLLLRDKAAHPALNASLASRKRRRRKRRTASRARASSSSNITTSSSPTPFRCPSCGSKFVTLNCTKNTNTNAKSLSCAKNGHARDVAKEGYANLLMTTNAIVGDAKEMVRSRKIFLDSGRFDFLFEEKLRGEVLRAIRRAGIFASSSSSTTSSSEEEDKDEEKRADVEEEEEEVSSSSGNNANGGGGSPRRKKLEAKKRLRALEKKEKKSKEARTVVFTIADVGCGDGYWLERISRWMVFGNDDDEEVAWLRERAKERNVRFRFIGMDASKEAVRVAAKRMIVKNTREKDGENKKLLDAEYFFAVADANDVPMGDDSIDIYLSVFAPRNGKEIARTLKEKGTLLVVSPSPSHLRELRSDEAKEKGVVCLDIEANKSERVEKQLKESASLFPTKEKEAAAEDTKKASLVVERAAPMDWRDVQLVLKMGASGFHQTRESLAAARSYWEERSDEDKKLTLSFRVCAFSRRRD